MNLMRLPTEVLHQIVNCLDMLMRAKEHEGRGPLHRDHDKILMLNSMRSLSAVNKKFYHICSPLVWETLKFPTDLPMPLTFWTKVILPIHGQHVQSLTITVSIPFNFSPASHSGQYVYTTKRENVHIHLSKQEMIQHRLYTPTYKSMCSPATLLAILDQCPNLQSLDLAPSPSGGWIGYYKSHDKNNPVRPHSTLKKPVPEYQYNYEDNLWYCQSDEGSDYTLDEDYDTSDDEGYEDVHSDEEETEEFEQVDEKDDHYADGVDNFMMSLVGPLSKLSKLRHLGIHCGKDGCSCTEKGLAQLISTIPHLNSFAIHSLPFYIDDLTSKAESQTLGWQLSRLNFLTHLEIRMATAWSSYSWLSKITNLTLGTLDHQLTHIFAPSLLCLKLISVREDEPQPYQLPQLTQLHLEKCYETCINHFTECKNLRRIEFNDSAIDWVALQELVVSQTWPFLQHIQISNKFGPNYEPDESDNPVEKLELEKFCDGAGIVFVYEAFFYDSESDTSSYDFESDASFHESDTTTDEI